MPWNEEKNRRVRALVLMSGGLDSSIAARLLLEQDIEVIGLYFYTGFCVTAQKAKTGRKTTSGNDYQKSDVVSVAENLGIQLEMLDVSKEYIPMVSRPRFGYGKNMNPCIDCRVFMLTETRKLLDFYDADFIATGEVVGQRPKSQKRVTQKLIAREAEVEGLLLRPLSARLMPETLPEKKNWVEREKLLGLQGRSRKPQLRLAEKWNITEAATPAGGCCFLADETYSTRFRDLVSERQNFLGLKELPPLSQSDVILLGVGRHFKIRPGLKLIVGRDEGENKLLEHFQRGRLAVEVLPGVKGPVGLLEVIEKSEDSEHDIESWGAEPLVATLKLLEEFIDQAGISHITANEFYVAAAIIARYSKGEGAGQIRIGLIAEDRSVTAETSIWAKETLPQDTLEEHMIVKKG